MIAARLPLFIEVAALVILALYFGCAGRTDRRPAALRVAEVVSLAAGAFLGEEACIRLYFALMILGCEQDLPIEAVVEEGRAVLSGLIGGPLATLIFGDLDRTLPKISDLRTLREYLEEGLRIWLPS